MSSITFKLSLTAMFVFFIMSGCAVPEKGADININDKSHDTVFIPVMEQLNEELREIASKSDTIKTIQENGILVASIMCMEDNLCSKDEYGTERGFEIDILKRISMLLGVKLNITEGEGASIIDHTTDPADNIIQTSYPYFYSAEEGWSYFFITGDQAFADTISEIIRHLYETGTYQQMYKNNFKQDMAQ